MVGLGFNYHKKMNVFSAFNGIGCAAYVLQQLGIPIEKYYASEIDPRANFIATKNYPKTIHFGDITKIRAHHFLDTVDFMCGGSPCQDLSIAGKMVGLDGSRSRLFFDFIRLWKALGKPKFFFENVRMKKESQDRISELFGCEPIYFDSALVSAQTRKRVYWTNLVSKEDFVYPEDRGIVLADILEFGDTDDDKSYCIGSIYKYAVKRDYLQKHNRQMIKSNTCVKVGDAVDFALDSSKRVYIPFGKSPCLNTQNGGGQFPKVANLRIAGISKLANGNIRPYQGDVKKSTVSEIGTIHNTANKSSAIIKSHVPNIITHSSQPRNDKGQGGKGHLQKEDGKSYCIDTTCTTIVEYADTYRKLTPIEVERCFSLPDNFTQGISNSARYHGLGNGWECATIAEFFKYLKP